MDFNVVNIAGSYAADRFMIVFTPSGSITTHFYIIKSISEK